MKKDQAAKLRELIKEMKNNVTFVNPLVKNNARILKKCKVYTILTVK